MKKHFLTVLGLFLLAYPLLGQNISVERIDPPFWWAGMQKDIVQLTVHGDQIGSSRPSVEYEGAKITRIIKSDNPNYVFIDLKLQKDVKPGKIEIQFTNKDTSIKTNYELKQRRPLAGRQKGLDQEDVIYLIMPDRFANGDPANDNMAGFPDKMNRADPDGRHGGDLKGITDHLDYLKELGVTALWLTPFQENNMTKISYHGYSMTNHFLVDPRLGSNEDYLKLVEEAHDRGIKVILDVVFNQVGNEHYFIKDLPMADWIHQFDEFTRSNFESVSVLDIHSSQYDQKVMTDGWFDTIMPDMNQNNPFVSNYLKQYVTWWIEYANLDAVRFDTYPYNDKEMLAEWAREIKAEYPDFFSFGEILIPDIGADVTSYWQEQGHGQYESYIQSTVDFPVYYGMINALKDGGTIRSLYDVLAKDYLYFDPAKNITLNGNHDVDRIHTILGENTHRTKMMAGILMTMRGIPQIYYGDEILMTGFNDGTSDGPRRKDFPGAWPDDRLNLFDKNNLDEEQKDYFEYFSSLLDWRKNNPELIKGELIHFVPQNEIYVYFRQKDDKAAMVIINNNKEAQSLNLDKFTEILFRYTSGKNIFSQEEIDLKKSLRLKPESVAIIDLHAK